MARLSLGQKTERVLAFLMGVRNRRVAASLGAHGFGNDDLDEGWNLMRALTTGRLDVTMPAVLDPAALVALDTWENKWFPIARASLLARFPAVHAVVFRNLVQTDGPEVMISVGTFLTRLGELKSTREGKEALKLLAKRGITEAVIGDASGLLEKLGSIDTTAEPESNISPEEEARREAALWAWYREWSEIAQTVITDLRSLRALGYRDHAGRAFADDEADDGEDPVVAPGIPGAGPFIDDEEENK